MEIQRRWLGLMTGTRTLVIAEIGVNHNGSLDLAKQLIEKAKWAGADVAKFQTWKTENVVTRSAPKVGYQKESCQDNNTQYEMLKMLELPYSDFVILKEHCKLVGIEFMSTADEYESAVFLNALQERIKIGSAELTDWPFLRKTAAFQKPIILSTGMAMLDEVLQAIEVIEEAGLKKDMITVLHCSTLYPTTMSNVNLRAMDTMKKALSVEVGYSDHTLGIEVPIAAVALGARVIEKHFTLDSTMAGPDHRASMEPQEFKIMVASIRNIEAALGDGIKRPSVGELKNRNLVRKSIVAKKVIHAGETFNVQNVTVKRPGTGISPVLWELVIGKTAQRDFSPDDFITLEGKQ